MAQLVELKAQSSNPSTAKKSVTFLILNFGCFAVYIADKKYIKSLY
jgi:hypothetical protein